MSRCNVLLALMFALVLTGFAQVQSGQAQAQAQPNGPRLMESMRPDYELGPNDQILIGVPQSQEIDQRPFRVDSEGNIELPLVGKVHAAGLTVRGLETMLTSRLRDYIREPQVSITVVQFRSEPVFFLGAFKAPGIYPLQGGRTLIEMLAVVGGLMPNASRRITITRKAEYGVIDLPNAMRDRGRNVSTVEVSLDSLMRNVNPAEDIVLKAYDVITVDVAKPVFVAGEVGHPGPVEFNGSASMSVVQVLSQAGFTPGANRSKIKVLRTVLGTNRRAEIDLDLNRIYEGKANDFPLLPNDVVYVPRATLRNLLAPMGTSLISSVPFILIGLAVSGAL
jgi:polysaccharide biosynthesis/export protein